MRVRGGVGSYIGAAVHVKFLFATTEVNKVPVTVLSRCQRFDLRRIPAEKLAAHFAQVSNEEGVEVEGEALNMIARAAEGSARDGLSILDQAIAHDRFFLDRLATHILAFEGDSHVEWFEGNFQAYEEDKIRRLGEEATRPHRTSYRKLTR